MRVLGLDPGTALLGWGVLEGEGEPHLVAYGVVKTPAGHSLAERLQMLVSRLREIVAHFTPDTAALEELFFARNVRTAFAVGQARGACLVALAEAGLPVHEYTPLQVKQAVTGYGRADKTQVQRMVRSLLHLEEIPRPDDAADALAVALCHFYSARMEEKVRQALEE